jgi:flavin prenyltransferase
MREFVIGITGASGVVYAFRLLEKILKIESIRIHIVVSEAARQVIKEELEVAMENEKDFVKYFFPPFSNFVWYDINQLNVGIASGSYPVNAMAVIPASMGTIAAIANGLSNNLIERAADVCLKEHKKLILVPRETPWSSIHLENCLKLSRCGAVVLPACPSFYSKAKTILELVDSVVFRVIYHLGLSDFFSEYRKYIYTWQQGWRDLNPQPPDLESGALPS